MDQCYRLFPELMLRAPNYSFAGYDPARLPEVVADPVFRNALWLASPGFYGLMAQKAFDFERLAARERHTLLKYYNRMSWRPVPFGSFASFSVLPWGNGPVELADDTGALLHLLPDRGPIIAGTLDAATPLRLNPTLYRFGKAFRYTRSVPDAAGRYVFSLDSLEAAPFYARLFSLIRTGQMRANDLAENVSAYSGCTAQEAMNHVYFLVAEQVLYTPAQGHLVSASAGQEKGTVGISEALVEKHDPATFYAVLERPVFSGGPGGTRRDLEAAITVLQRLALPPANTALDRFIKDFRARFDRQKVPLLLALDPDHGLAYDDLGDTPAGGGSLDGLHFPGDQQEPKVGWTAVHRLLFRLQRECQPYAPLVLRDEDLDSLPPDAGLNYPPTTAVVFREAGGHLLIEQAGGATGTAVSGRFSVFSEAAGQLAGSLAAAEEAANPGVVFADIGALSDLHVDNVSYRRQLYRYEIPLNVFSELSAEARLEPGDLLLSVQNNELVLESRRLGKRVIPRLASAFNFRHSRLPLFRLLCDLQYQGLQGSFSLDPEQLFPGLDFYPRVSYGRTVLSPARWRLDEVTLSGSNDDFLDTLYAWRTEHRVPRHVTLGSGDRQLVFDLGDEQEAFFFRDCLRGQPSAVLREYLVPGREVRAGGKPLAAQYVASLVQDKPVYSGILEKLPVKEPPAVRDWLPGGPWLSLEIYCTELSADRILSTVMRPLLRKHAASIKEWFFVRYRDPEHHLRFRVRADEASCGLLLSDFRARLKGPGGALVRDCRSVAYRRELERYGHALIGPAEALFHAGSELVVRRSTSSELELGLLTAYTLISCFIPEFPEQLRFADSIAAGFLAEFKADKQLRLALDLKYREMKGDIARALGGKLTPVQRGFRNKAIAIARLSRDLDPGRRQALLADLVHMQVNRSFATEQRRHELLVYYCLAKWLRSLIARA